MRAVLYTEDLQPIAIVELTPNEKEIITHGGVLRLAISQPMKIVPYSAHYDGIVHQPDVPLTKIYGNWMRDMHGTQHLFLFAKHAVLELQEALSLSDLSP